MERKKIGKPAIVAIVAVAALAAAFAIFLPLYLKHNEENRNLYKLQKIRVSAFGVSVGEYTIDEILALDGVTEKAFTAVYDTSNSEPVEKIYCGIEVRALLSALDIDLSAASTVTFAASDGANKVYSPLDVARSDNVFIAYKVEGRDFHHGIDGLGHTRPEEDGGPYVVIKRSDAFSQNRCKLLVEVKVE